MGGADYASADDSMGGYSDEPREYGYGLDHDYLNLNSSMWEFKSQDSIFLNIKQETPRQVTDTSLEELDRWKDGLKALHTTAKASNSLFSIAANIGYEDINYRTAATKSAIAGSKSLGSKLGVLGFGLSGYDYFRAMGKGDYRRAFAASFNVLVGVGIGAVAVPFGLGGPLGMSVSGISNRYDIGGRTYDRINTMIDEGYAPEPGVFW